MKESIGYWANIYTKRLLAVLMYNSGEMTVEEATIAGKFNDVNGFLRFSEVQMEYGRKLRVSSLMVECVKQKADSQISSDI